MKRNTIVALLLIMALSAAGQKPKSEPTPVSVPMSKNVNVPDKDDRTNNFYDNEEVFSLPVQNIIVEGEIENPSKIDLSKLQKHTVIVKEALLNKDTGNHFVGAYRYDGYSLFDILNHVVLKKSNAAEFNPIIDLYVEIENERGDKVVVSWGEIYYPNVLHNILIATEVMRIVPNKSKDLWPLPVESKLIVGHDLLTERNISNPMKITVKSYARSYKVDRNINPLVSEQFTLWLGENKIGTYTDLPPKVKTETLHTIFYGRGRGIHSTQPFTGAMLHEYMKKNIPFTQKNLREGLVVMAGIDGYRAVYSLSEIMNRNDQAAVLLVPCPEEKDGGKFRIFPSCDFFSDRAVKALTEIRIEMP